MATTKPRNGSDETMLAEHLTKLAVWKILLLRGTWDYSDEAIVARLAKVGVEVAREYVPRLYQMAVENAAGK